MPQPNGYRKALRFMKHADKFGLPIVTFVDTPGAFAGKSAEESGQASESIHKVRTNSACTETVILARWGQQPCHYRTCNMRHDLKQHAVACNNVTGGFIVMGLSFKRKDMRTNPTHHAKHS